MEERRLLLAVVLSIAVLIGWQVFFAPKPLPPSEVTEQPVVESTEGAPETVAVAPQTVETRPGEPPPEATTPLLVEGELGVLEAGEPKKVVIQTDLYRCVISTGGGYLESFTLKNFREISERDSPPKELITPDLPPRYSPLVLELNIGGKVLPPTAVYSANQAEIDLTGVPDGSTQKLSLTLKTRDGLLVERAYSFTAGDYNIGIETKVSEYQPSTGETPMRGRVSETASIYWYTEINPDKKTSRFITFAAVVYAGQKFSKTNPDKLRKKGPFKYPKPLWAGFADGYFLRAIIPAEELSGVVNDYGEFDGAFMVKQTFKFKQGILESGVSRSYKATLYMGPKDFDLLRAFGTDLSLDRAVEYGRLEIFIRPLIFSLKFFHGLVNNWGLAIILLTVAIKILFYPLTYKSHKSMKAMQELQPRIKELQEKHKGDREKINQEMMALYRVHKVNPVGGCLPMLLQLPVLYALYRCLYVSIDLRHANFIGWITDLSAPEQLFFIPVMGGISVGLMPLLMGGSMFVQQKMTPTTMDPAQAKMFMMMPVVFTFISFGFPSGLVLYWSVSNLLTIAQQYWINRKGS